MLNCTFTFVLFISLTILNMMVPTGCRSPWLLLEAPCGSSQRPAGGAAPSGVVAPGEPGADRRSGPEPPWGCSAALTPPTGASSGLLSLPRLGSSWRTMVAKSRKQTGRSPATPADRDRNPLVSPPGKSGGRRPGREGKAGSHPNGLSGIGHKLGLSPSALGRLGITLLLGKLAPLAC